jgi:uncharacterized protein
VIIYIHGFNSSARSFKARALGERLTALGCGDAFLCPDLPHRPQAAIALLDSLVAAQPGACLVGSSLGGFYATWLAERHRLRAVLLNPAVRPYELLRGYLGTQTNLYSAERYELTEAHLEELRALDVETVTPARYLLIVATGDEVLDHCEALAKYRGARQIVIAGGDHGFSDFEKHLATVLSFCGMADCAASDGRQ